MADRAVVLEAGSYVDVLDSSLTWRVAQIQAVDALRGVFIHYDGWGQKWSEWLAAKSPRIASFRKYTRRYTGQESTTHREWTFQADFLHSCRGTLLAAQSDLQQFGCASEVTQFFTGQLFTLVDCLLGWRPADESELSLVLSFLEEVLHFAVWWIRNLPSRYPLIYQSMSNPDLVFSTKEVAFAAIWPELFMTVERLLGADPRLQELLTLPALHANSSASNSMTTHHFLVEAFLTKEAGYQVILEVLQGKDPIPLELIPSLPVWVLFPLFRHEHTWRTNFLHLSNALLHRLTNFSDTDIRYYDKSTVQKLQELVKTIAKESGHMHLFPLAETAELQVSKHLLTSKLLDKRVKGINNFHEAILRGTVCRSDGFLHYRGEELAKWFQKENILSVIITDRPHYEIIKRSGDVFSFLAEHGLLTSADITTLWTSAVDKHESYTRVVYDLLATLADFLPAALLTLVCRHFRSVNNYSDFLIQSMKKFTLNASSALCRVQKATKMFFLEDFISILTSAPVLSQGLIEVIAVTTVDLYWFEALRKFQPEIFTLLLSEQAYLQAGTLPLSVAFQILRKGTEVQVRELLTRLGHATSQSLIDRTLHWATHFHLQSAGDLRLILEFLGTLASKGIRVVAVTEKEVMVLWDCFTSARSVREQSEEFFEWLSQCVANKSAFLIEETLQKIFSRFSELPAGAIGRLGLQSFNCFQQLFFHTNYLYQNLNYKEDSVLIRFGRELYGLNTLVSFVAYSGNPAIQQLAIKLLSQLHLRLHITVPDLVVEDFIATRVAEMGSNVDLIAGNLAILVGLLEEYESITTCKPTPLLTKDTEIIYYRLQSELTYKSVTLSRVQPLSALRKHIALTCNLPPENVHFDHGATSYCFLDDQKQLNQLDHPLFFTVKSSGEQYKFIPIANSIANNETAVEKMFELLSNERFREQSWFILSRLTSSEGIKMKIRALGSEFRDLMDTNSLHKQLLGLKVLQEVSLEHEFTSLYTSTHTNELLTHIVAKFISLNEDFVSYFAGFDPVLTSQYAETQLRLLWKFSNRPSSFDMILSLANISKCMCELLYLYAKNADMEMEQRQSSVPSCVYFLLVSITKHKEEFQEVKHAIGTYKNLKNLILAGLIRPKHPQFAMEMKSFFLQLSQSPFLICEEISATVLTVLDSAVTEKEADPQFFYLASKLLQRSTNISPQPYFESLFSFLQLRPPEESYKTQDKGLTGALKLMRTLVKLSPELSTPVAGQYILQKCLIDFNETQASQRLLPKCKSHEARLAAFKCLGKLIQLNPTVSAIILKELSAFFTNLSWRKSKVLHWNHSYSPQEKSSTGFVGLKNLGCTCYMNSLLQQLFQISSFREGLFQCDLPESNDQVLYQLQKIAAGLIASDKVFVQARGLCQAYLNWEGLPINPLEQMDVEEFFNGLMDKVETGLKDTSRPKLVEEHFKGVYTTQCIGKGSCSHRSERDESFLTLPLEIKNKSSILQSLDALITGEVLEGDNAYACDYCGQMVTASRRICLRSLPNLLLLTLRRFDFDMDTMTRLKLNSYCEFPLKLDMEPYTIEGVLRRERGEEEEERLGVTRAPQDYYQYTLRGIIIHLGSAEAGHYYSYINTEEKGWVEFNDTCVDPFDAANIPHEAFGVLPGLLGDASKEEVGKMKNAYVLIYERKVRYAVKGKDDALPEPLPVYPREVSPSTRRLLTHYQTSNLKYWKIKRVFSPEFFSFITKLSFFTTPASLTFCLFYYLTINIRAKDRSQSFFDQLYDRIPQSADTSWCLLGVLSYEPVLREVLIQCPVLEVRKCIIALAEKCVQMVPVELREAVIIRLTEMIPKFPERVTKEQSSFFELLFLVARLHPTAAIEVKLPMRVLHSLIGRAQDLAPLPSLVPTSADLHLGRDPDLTSGKYPSASEASPYFTNFHIAILNDFIGDLDPAELSLLQDSSIVDLLVRGAYGRFGGNQSARLFSRFMENTPPEEDLVFRTCVHTLIGELRNSEADYFRSPLVQLRRIVSISDEFQYLRVGVVMGELAQVLLDNLTFIRITETLVVFMYKLAQRVRPVRLWLQENTAHLAALNVWKQRYATWSLQSTNSLQLNKGYSALTQLADFHPNATVSHKATSILTSKIGERIFGYDSDEDLYDAPLTKYSSAEMQNKDETRYRVAIQHCYGPALYVKYEDYPSYPMLFVASDDDRLMYSDKLRG